MLFLLFQLFERPEEQYRFDQKIGSDQFDKELCYLSCIRLKPFFKFENEQTFAQAPELFIANSKSGSFFPVRSLSFLAVLSSLSSCGMEAAYS